MKKETVINRLKKELNVTKIVPTSGLSNDNYLLDNTYHLKITYDNHFPLCTDISLLKAAHECGLGVKIIEKYVTPFFQLSYYQKDLKSFREKDLTDDMLDKIVDGIKKFHDLPYSSTPKISIKDLCRQFLLCDFKPALGFLDLFAPLPEDKLKVPVHLDLILDNILFNKEGEIKIIDYDLAIVSDSYLDIVSLLSENHFSPEQEKHIVNRYFDNEQSKNDFTNNYPVYHYYFDLLWSVWARVRKAKAPAKKKKIYAAILKEKFESAEKFAETEI